MTKAQFVYQADDLANTINVFRNGLPFGVIQRNPDLKWFCRFTSGGNGPLFQHIKDVQANIEAAGEVDAE